MCNVISHISTGLPVCYFVCDVNHHYQVWVERRHTQQQRSYITFYAVPYWITIIFTWPEEMNIRFTWFIFHVLINEYNINPKKCTTVFGCSLIRQIYNIKLTRACAQLLSFPTMLDARLQFRLVNRAVHTATILLGTCTTIVLSSQHIHSHYSISILARSVTCMFSLLVQDGGLLHAPSIHTIHSTMLHFTAIFNSKI
jgi:hypothetical protein